MQTSVASSVAEIVTEAVAVLASAVDVMIVAVVGSAVGPPCGTLCLDNLDIPGEDTRPKDTLSDSSSVPSSQTPPYE